MPFTETPRPDGKRQRRYFDLPTDLPFREFTMRELDGVDDLTIAIWVDRKRGTVTDIVSRGELKLNEGIRRSLVDVDGRPVNQHDVPFAPMDNWSHRTMVFMMNAYNALNGVEEEELKKFQTPAESTTKATTTLAPVPSGEERSVG